MGVQTKLPQAYMESHPEAAAAFLEHFPAEGIAATLTIVTTNVAAGVLGRMAPGTAAACLAELRPDTACALLQALPLHLTSALLRRVPAGHRDRLVAALPSTISGPVARLLRYPERTAGALLDPLVTALPLDVSASDAIDAVRSFPERVDHEVFVIGRDQTLIGSITLRALVAAPATASLETLASPISARFSPFSDPTAMLASPAWADTHTVPVVDGRGLYLGAVRHDAIRHVAGDGATEPLAAASFSTFMSLSELCWSGCAGLTAALVAFLGGQPSRGTHDV